ncbi:glycosyltransferase [Spiribacter sp. 218]|uniref:glycosyltransferase n=1 Tax=Spiribacter pallidus TaxID=1987936 RepID=UPI00349F8A59
MIESDRPPKVLIAANKGHITEIDMIKGLRQDGVDVHAALASDSPHLDDLRDGGVPTRTLNLKSNADLLNALRIRRWIKEEGFDIVHGLANRQVANFIWASYGLPNKVIAYRGAIGHVSRWDPSCYLKWLSPRIDKIVCVSKAVERDLAASGVRPEKLVTIYKGHDLNWYEHLDPVAARAEVNAQFDIPEHAFLVGMAANMRRVKGADLLLRAIMELPDHVHGLLIGEVRDPLIYKLIQDPRLTNRVHLAGYRQDVTKLIGALDVNVAPSRGREGLTKTIIEGMAQKIPAVVSNVGGLPELIRDAESGYIVPKEDLPLLSERIYELTTNRLRRTKMGETAKNDVYAHFDLASSVARTAEMYHIFKMTNDSKTTKRRKLIRID